MKVVLIEDEALTAERLEDMIKRYDPSIEIAAVLASVEASVNWFKEHNLPDLIFMDIHLEDDDCFNIFEQVNVQVPVIFTTAYDEYMIQAFKVNSIDYLMKPVNYEEIEAAFEKYKKIKSHYQEDNLGGLLQSLHRKEETYKDRFLVSFGFKMKTIETDAIKYFYCIEKATFLATTESASLPIEYSLDKLSMLLNPKKFFRVNRQFIVNHSAITTIQITHKGRLQVHLVPAAKEEVLVSIDRATAFKEWLGK